MLSNLPGAQPPIDDPSPPTPRASGSREGEHSAPQLTPTAGTALPVPTSTTAAHRPAYPNFHSGIPSVAVSIPPIPVIGTRTKKGNSLEPVENDDDVVVVGRPIHKLRQRAGGFQAPLPPPHPPPPPTQDDQSAKRQHRVGAKSQLYQSQHIGKRMPRVPQHFYQQPPPPPLPSQSSLPIAPLTMKLRSSKRGHHHQQQQQAQQRHEPPPRLPHEHMWQEFGDEDDEQDEGEGEEGHTAHVRAGAWTLQEDRTLEDLVAEHGSKNWQLIASKFPGRSSRQCRSRWLNHVQPRLQAGRAPKLGPRAWTPEEDSQLIHYQSIYGNTWTDIAKQLAGRSPLDISNRWSNLRKREERAFTQDTLSSFAPPVQLADPSSIPVEAAEPLALPPPPQPQDTHLPLTPPHHDHTNKDKNYDCPTFDHHHEKNAPQVSALDRSLEEPIGAGSEIEKWDANVGTFAPSSSSSSSITITTTTHQETPVILRQRDTSSSFMDPLVQTLLKTPGTARKNTNDQSPMMLLGVDQDQDSSLSLSDLGNTSTLGFPFLSTPTPIKFTPTSGALPPLFSPSIIPSPPWPVKGLFMGLQCDSPIQDTTSILDISNISNITEDSANRSFAFDDLPEKDFSNSMQISHMCNFSDSHDSKPKAFGQSSLDSSIFDENSSKISKSSSMNVDKKRARKRLELGLASPDDSADDFSILSPIDPLSSLSPILCTQTGLPSSRPAAFSPLPTPGGGSALHSHDPLGADTPSSTSSDSRPEKMRKLASDQDSRIPEMMPPRASILRSSSAKATSGLKSAILNRAAKLVSQLRGGQPDSSGK